MLPFFMHGDGFILSEEDLKRYNGHHQIDKYYFAEGSRKSIVEPVCPNTSSDELKQWLRPTKINAHDFERWKATPALRILMIKTQNEFSRNPREFTPSHRTIPGCTEVTPLENHGEQIRMIRELFQHARLPLAAVGAYLKSHITFLSAPSYELLDDEGTSGGEVTKYYCSGTSWSIAWNYFHATRHTTAVLFYREGDGAQRRVELEYEIQRLRQHITHPLLLAYIKTQISLVWTFQLLEQMNGQTFEIEKNVGLATWDWCLDRELGPYRDPNLEDPESEENIARAQKKAVERYNVLSSKLINIRFRLRSFREQISWLRRMNRNFLNSLTYSTDNQGGARRKECNELNTILDRMDDFTKIYLHDADTLADRLSQQMNTMSYLVTQRDSRISLAIADINNELAWQGKNTNSAMMAIATASFLFLPGIFIASVFQSPIFNFTPIQNEIVVKKPFWIFWLACGVSTALLCGSSYTYMKYKHAFDRARRLEAREDFRRRILRTPTLTRRTKRVGPQIEAESPEGGWMWFWNSRVGGLMDEEKGLGVLKVTSLYKRE